MISGLIIDAASDSNSDLKNYTPAFYLMLGPMIADIAFTYFLNYEQTHVRSRNIFKDVGHLFLDMRILVFMVWCTFIGVCFGMIWNFLFWYMEELADVQGPESQERIKTIEGLVGGIQCFLGEVPSYFLSGWILQKIGHGHAMSLTVFMAGARFLLYSVIEDPWWVLPVSVLQGMNGLFFPTMTSYAKLVAEPGTEATVQGLVSALCEGVGVALGSFIGGILVDQYGGAAAFRVFGIAAMAMTLFNIVAQMLLEKYGKKVSHQETKERVKIQVEAS